MRLSKRILSSWIVRRIASSVGTLYLNLVYATNRWTVVRGEIPARFWDEGKPFILALWHNRLLIMPKSWSRQDKKFHMLISQHRDGLLVAQIVENQGLHTIAGSSNKGGASALKRMVSALKAGEYVGITPDGPRGPRMRASDGVIAVARLSGVPVIPAAYGVSRRRVLGSWDRFVLALPFGRGVFVWGDPIDVPRDGDQVALGISRQKIEDALTAVTNEADELTGHAPIEPAPAAPAPAGTGAAP